MIHLHYDLECRECGDRRSTRNGDRDPASMVVDYLETHHRHTGVWVTPQDRVSNPPMNPFGALDG